MSFIEKIGVTAYLAFIVVFIAGIAGYVTNLYWLFRHMGTLNAEFIIAALGAVVFPLGSMHGIFTWF